MERHTSRRWTRAAAAAAAVTLFAALTACADDTSEADPNPADPGQQEQADSGGSQEGGQLTINSPREGDTVSVPFEVVADADVELGSIADRLHHMHVWFDDGDFLVFESDTAQIEQAPEGATTLWVQVHTYDHQPASEAVSVPLTVEGGNGAGAEDTSRAPAPPNDY